MIFVESVEHSPFSILHVTGSVNDSIALRGELRNAGLQAGVTNAADFDAVRRELAKTAVDVIYVEYGDNTREMLVALGELAAKEPAVDGVPMVVYDDAATTEDVEAYLAAGAFLVIGDESLVDPMLRRAVAVGLLYKDRDYKAAQLAKSELRCQKLIDGSAEPVAYIQDGLHIYANRAYLDLLGFESIDELLEEPILDLAIGESAGRLKAFLKKEEGEETFTMRAGGGHEIDVMVNSTAASFDGEPCLQIFASQVKEATDDISDQLEYFARRDLLTGLYNRNYLFEQIEARRTEIDTE
ncbi:MAG TPA: PAS domain-containing protein, partial [Halothiobacillaceae bacterium]|nr:PAS domain-containing protein [Halothiobacillaceae bacterium]